MGYYPDEIEKKLNEKAERQFSEVLRKLLNSNQIELTRTELHLLKRFLLVTKLRSKEMMDVITHARKVDIETFQKDPGTVRKALGRFITEVGSTESDYDYWLRSISCVLNEESGRTEELERRDDATFMAVHFSREFNAGYLAFWDAPDGEEFLISDVGLAEEMESVFYKDGYNHLKLDHLINLYNSCKSSDTEKKWQLHQMIEFNKSFFGNFYFFPFSPKRALVLINPYFKFIHGEFESMLTPHESIPNIESIREKLCELMFSKMTNFYNPKLTKPNKAEYKVPNQYSAEDRFVYLPIQLSSEELRRLNVLIIGSNREWLGISNFDAVKPSLMEAKRIMEKNDIPTDPTLWDILEHADDEEYLHGIETNTIFSELEKLDIPERFRLLLGRRVGLNYVIDCSNNEKYPFLAAAIVLSRNKLLQFGVDCDEETILKAMEKMELKTLERYARTYKSTGGSEFNKNMGAVFFEIEARKGSIESAYRIGRYYRDGRHVPKNIVKAKYYFLKGVEKDDGYSRIALSQLYAKQGKLNEAVKVAIGPNGAKLSIQYHVRAQAYFKLNDIKKAISDFEKALEMNYLCSTTDLLNIYLDDTSQYFNLRKAEEIVDHYLPKHPAAGLPLAKYYAKYAEKHPEYKDKIEHLVDEMVRLGYTTVSKIKLI